MPYIKEINREDLKRRYPLNPGELNYYFTLLIKEYIKDKQLSYQTINDIVGALSCASSEFYRRVVIPYENEKIKTNGDVYS